ncbi:HNH endonuclease [Pseudomonas syringae group genomosp. 3]|uniref:HNH endonuclease n=1 Tax=Pseudomonas syringae group genomosp. 3 TaxID=251701 RepID=UPI001067B3C4|nr:HNH endonuclease [Pseudomonas syringae group genomosp. 3]TES74090.1 HNH endonuclease [Pseudomonas syringae pv. tomato]
MSVHQVQRKPMKFGPIDGMCFDSSEEYFSAITAKEAQAIESFRGYLDENFELLSYVSKQGDGEGGRLILILKQALFGARPEHASPYRKKKIPDRLRTLVMERDMYRCVRCGSYRELCADHIFPEVLGGEASLDNLQTLCRPCNTSKGGRAEVSV